MKHTDFDSLYQTYVRPYFDALKDWRRSNSTYSLADSLSSVFAMFSLKSPSLLDFEKRSQTESNHISAVYGISAIPSDSQVRNILDTVDTADFSGLFSLLYQGLGALDILPSYSVLSSYLAVSMDGTGFFSSSKVSCPSCLQKQHKDGSLTCHHCM